MSKPGHWRGAARPIIAEVLAANKDKPEAEIKAALKKAYPFGLRENFPYKVWLDEIRVQRGKRRFGEGKKSDPNNPAQSKLF